MTVVFRNGQGNNALPVLMGKHMTLTIPSAITIVRDEQVSLIQEFSGG